MLYLCQKLIMPIFKSEVHICPIKIAMELLGVKNKYKSFESILFIIAMLKTFGIFLRKKKITTVNILNVLFL